MTAHIWTTAKVTRWCPRCGEEILEILAAISASYFEHWHKVDDRWVLASSQDHEIHGLEASCANCNYTLAIDPPIPIFELGLDHEPTQQELDNA